MALQFYDSENEVTTLGNFFFNGRWGSVQEQIFYLRNGDSSRYYTNIMVAVVSSAYDALSEFGDTGWSIKFLYGQRRPTEAEWDLVRSGEPIVLPDIGTTDAADTFTYHPVWVRIFCPARESAQIIDSFSLQVSFVEKLVGA